MAQTEQRTTHLKADRVKKIGYRAVIFGVTSSGGSWPERGRSCGADAAGFGGGDGGCSLTRLK